MKIVGFNRRHTRLVCLVKEVGEADSAFSGSFVGVSSYFDKARVGTAPNETNHMVYLKDLRVYERFWNRRILVPQNTDSKSDHSNAATA